MYTNGFPPSPYVCVRVCMCMFVYVYIVNKYHLSTDPSTDPRASHGWMLAKASEKLLGERGEEE